MVDIQKTYQNQIATLFLVTTPIGDQIEISPRTLETLKKVAVIFCEDTQYSQRFLKKLAIEQKLLSFHKFNEKNKINHVLKYLRSGSDVALISCAGTPLIADPGYQLVVEVVKAGFNVTSVGISSPLIAALICSTIPCHKFVFQNFLLPSRQQKAKQIANLLSSSETIVCYESVHKLADTLKNMQQVAPQRRFCLAREISKRHETFYRGVLGDLNLKTIVFKGEFVLVIEGQNALLSPNLQHFVDKMKKLDLTNKQIVSVGKELNYSKSQLYKTLGEE